jgi:hypothetical protein
MTIDLTADPAAGLGAEVLRGRQGQFSFLGAAHDGGGQGVLARAFQAGGKSKDHVRGEALGPHGNQLGLAFGERAGLVQHERVDPGQGF